MNLRVVILAHLLLIIGCTTEPRNTQTKSTKFAPLDDRVEFLNEYLTVGPNRLFIGRTYETLDFDISYRRGKKFPMVGNSLWDYRIVATVPASEVPRWIPSRGKAVTDPDISWVQTVPTSLDLSGVTEWYVRYRSMYGVDRSKSIVVCRLLGPG